MKAGAQVTTPAIRGVAKIDRVGWIFAPGEGAVVSSLPLFASRRSKISPAFYRTIEGQQGLSDPFRKIPTSKACRQYHSSSLPVTTMPDGGSDLDRTPSTSSNTSVSVV